MKVLALVPEAYRGFGGIAQYNRDLIAALARSKNVESVRVLPRLAAAPSEPIPKKVSQAEPIYARSLYALNAVREALRIRPEVIFCGHLYTAPLAQYVAKLIGAPFVVQLHGTEIWEKPSVLQAHALEEASAILCVSRHTRAQVLRFTRANPNRVVVIPNTVGADYRPGDRDASRQLFGLKDEFALLTVGRLDGREGYKGHDRVIEALAKLPNDRRHIVYLISGDGDDRPRLEALAGDYGLIDRVRFLGFTPRQNLPDLYRAADLFVMPSTGEGFGIVFIEAIASGTPAMGFALGGAADPLDFGEWGRAVTAEKLTSSIAEAIAIPRPEPAELHDAVNARFGFGIFAGQIDCQIAKRFSPVPTQICN